MERLLLAVCPHVGGDGTTGPGPLHTPDGAECCCCSCCGSCWWGSKNRPCCRFLCMGSMGAMFDAPACCGCCCGCCCCCCCCCATSHTRRLALLPAACCCCTGVAVLRIPSACCRARSLDRARALVPMLAALLTGTPVKHTRGDVALSTHADLCDSVPAAAEACGWQRFGVMGGATICAANPPRAAAVSGVPTLRCL